MANVKRPFMRPSGIKTLTVSPTEEKLQDKAWRKVPADIVEEQAAHVAAPPGYQPNISVIYQQVADTRRISHA